MVLLPQAVVTAFRGRSSVAVHLPSLLTLTVLPSLMRAQGMASLSMVMPDTWVSPAATWPISASAVKPVAERVIRWLATAELVETDTCGPLFWAMVVAMPPRNNVTTMVEMIDRAMTME